MTRGADFWARRKAAVRAEEEAEARAAEAHAEAETRAALEERSDEEILAELNLPDPDSLESGDDIRAFMDKAVPDRLRRRALRRLWRLNPVLANVDGLVDYGEDFTDGATVIENLQTAYQVGKGMRAHVEEMARKASLAEAAEGEAQEPDAPTLEMPETVQAISADSGNPAASDAESAAEPKETAPDETDAGADRAAQETENQPNQSDTRFAAPRGRRMRFAVDG